MEREACVCDHGFERSDLCAEIIIIIIINLYLLPLLMLQVLYTCFHQSMYINQSLCPIVI